jgi:catechol 2,3-dioxygenase
MRLGPVLLKVKDLGLMLSFYERDLGLKVLHRDGNIVELGPRESGEPILVLRNVPSAEKPPLDAAGLYHYAFLVPNRRSLAAAYLSLGNAGIIFNGFADHLVSEALYLMDPEGNGIEIYADRARDQWKFDEEGYVDMATQPLDLDSLLKQVSGVPRDALKAIAEGTRIGHVHLKVTNLQKSIAFYTDVLGLDLMRYYGSAALLSVGRYHHHVGMNTWESLDGQTNNKAWAGLENFTITIPKENLNELHSMLTDSPFVHNQGTGRLFISDPDDIELIVKAY